MKTQLTTEQSKHLFDLGVPEKMANGALPNRTFSAFKEYYDVFTLTDLLDILPKEIEWEYGKTPIIITFGSCTSPNPNIWFAYYDDIIETNSFSADELIDVLYELIIWCIKNGYLKFE